MAFNTRLKANQQATTSTPIAGAAPQELDGKTVLMGPLDPGGTVLAEFVLAVKTSSLVMKVLWQYSQDNSTWIDLPSAETYSSAAGTGSTVSTTGAIKLATQIPAKYVRAAVRTSGATADGVNDAASIKYHWLTQRPGANA